MGPLAIFGITNDGLNLAVKLLLLFLAAIWLALVFWTFADARRRIADPLLVACATAASLFFPFLGTIVYAIVRPPEFLADVHERELEIAAAEARLHQAEGMHCPHCDFEVEKTFLRCPSCLRRLKEPCTTCGRPLDPRWKICPYCEAEVGQAPAARQPRRPASGQRRAASSGAQPRPSGAAQPRPSTAAAQQPRPAQPQRSPNTPPRSTPRPSGVNQQRPSQPVQQPQQPTQEFPAPTPRPQSR
jgi:double zinc ribbon protein